MPLSPALCHRRRNGSQSREHTLSTTPAEGFPRSTAAAPTMADYISTGQYLWGLRRVLDGITVAIANPGEGGPR